MSHRNAITDSDDPKFKRNPARGGDPFPDLDGQRTEVGMSGHDIVPCICYPDKRPVKFLIGDPKRSEQRPVGCTLIALLDFITPHRMHICPWKTGRC